MTQPLKIEPGDVLEVANGHLVLVNQLGQVLADLGPAPGDWPSHGAVSGMNAAMGALTATQQARLGDHAGALTQTAGTYTGQEAASASALKPGDKDMMNMMTSSSKDMLGLLTNTVKDVEGTVGAIAQVGASATASFGGAAASGGAAMISPLSSVAANAAKAHSDPGTSLAAAPAAGDDTKSNEGTKQHVVRNSST